MATYIERYQAVEKAGELHLKGKKFTEISRELHITPIAAANLVKEYKELLRSRAEGDPDFLERITENTLEAVEGFDLSLAEAWEAYETVKDNEIFALLAPLLKLTVEINEKKAKLLQLMGGSADGNSVARMNRAERVNEIITDVIANIVKECPRCASMAQIKLAEAFAIMGKADAGSTMQEYTEEDVVDAELISLPEHTH